MAFDEDLAERIRSTIEDPHGLSEKRMFGGLAFLVNGNMAVAASGRGGLLLRVDPGETESLVHEDGVARFEMRGRAMNGWLHIEPFAAASDEALSRWVGLGLAFARSLPPK